jgi:hypothetical protein
LGKAIYKPDRGRAAQKEKEYLGLSFFQDSFNALDH